MQIAEKSHLIISILLLLVTLCPTGLLAQDGVDCIPGVCVLSQVTPPDTEFVARVRNTLDEIFSLPSLPSDFKEVITSLNSEVLFIDFEPRFERQASQTYFIENQFYLLWPTGDVSELLHELYHVYEGKKAYLIQR